MAVLSFRKFLDSRADTARDWSQNEIGEFLRAHNLLSQNGVSIGIDRGLSDIGEPWLVFFDTQSQDVFLHVARIKGRCVLVSEPLELRLWASDVAELMQSLDESVRGFIKERDEHNSKVVLHPAARMIMAISAVFLLFKLDNSSNVYAKDDVHGAGDATRKYESSVMMRVQSAMNRLLEAAETPAAMAVVAGVLFASEFYKQARADAAEDDMYAADTVPSVREDFAVATLEEELVVSDEADGHLLPATPKVTLTIADTIIEVATDLVEAYAAHIDTEARDVPAAGTFDLSTFAQVAAEWPKTLPRESADPQPTPQGSLSLAVVLQMFDVDWVSADTVRAWVSREGEHLPTIGVGDPLLLDTDTTLDWTVVVDPKSPDLLGTPADALDVLTLDTLPGLRPEFGYYAETSVDSVDLGRLLAYFIRVFHALEIEYSGGDVLLEQASAAGNDMGELGIWRNIMNDGSVISVVGQASLIDDLPRLL